MRSFWSAVEGLDNVVNAEVQLEMLIDARRLVERSTRWLVRAYPDEFDIAVTTRYFAQGAKTLAQAMPAVLQGADRETYERRLEELSAADVPTRLALARRRCPRCSPCSTSSRPPRRHSARWTS